MKKLLKQKYRKLTFVKVAKEMPADMATFTKDFVGIVDGSNSELLGGDNIDKYSLYQIKNGKIVSKIAWYHEYQLTALEEQDRLKAADMIDDYYQMRLDKYVNGYYY